MIVSPLSRFAVSKLQANTLERNNVCAIDNYTTPPPLITIGMTCFNAEDTISRALKSAIQQTWKNFEIIIVDDASTDKSVQVIKSFSKVYGRIQLLIHSKNKGYPASLNTILKYAKGEFIAFFDDDDESSPDRLYKQFEHILDYEQKSGSLSVLCYTNRKVIQKENVGKCSTVKAIGRFEKEPFGEMVTAFLLWHSEVPGYSWGQFGSCSLMMRRQLLRSLGGFDVRFRRCAEWDLAIRASYRSAYFISVNESLVTQYITETEDKAGWTPLKYAIMLREKHKNYLKDKKLYQASKAIAYSRFFYSRGNKWKSRIFLILACALSPKTVLTNELSKHFSSNT